MASLKLVGVTKSFGPVAVIKGVDLDITDGEFVVFVGPSGCGKSTLLRMIAGLEQATTGDIVLDGSRVNEVAAADRGLAMVFQSYALYPHMTVYQNLSFGLENARMPKAEIAQRVGRAAKQLQIEPLMQRKPGQLSGGQRQRVAIGRAITRNPKIFLFDEPLSNLDAELRVQMRVELSALHADVKSTMIYVTHDQVEAMTMADKIVVLRAGKVEQVGRPLDLYNRPANRFVAGFIGSPRMNFVSGKVAAIKGDTLSVGGPGLPAVDVVAQSTGLAQTAPIVIGVRPEHLAVTTSGGWPMTVDTVEQLGGTSYLYGRLPSGEKLTVAAAGQTPLRAGATVHVTPAHGEVHIFHPGDDGAALARPAKS
jgi:multiple sugar transport system ATP-binding protein